MKLTVHIITHNSAKTLKYCLELILQQVQPNCVLVVDNASTDDSVAIAQQMNVQVYSNLTNQGYSTGHNIALNLTKSEYVMTLNPDAFVQPGCVAAFINALDINPTLGAVSGCLLRVESTSDTPLSVDGCGIYIERNRRQRLIAEGMPLDKRPTNYQKIFGVDGASACYRRTMLNDIAYNGEIFDEDFFIHKEDIDIAWRAYWRGWSTAYIPQAIIYHIRGFRPGQHQNTSFEIRWYALRNRYFLLLKHETFYSILQDFHYIMLYEIMIIGYLIISYPSLLSVYINVLQNWEKISKKRENIILTKKITQMPFNQI
jgi:GT2 family glycosyltransferase